MTADASAAQTPHRCYVQNCRDPPSHAYVMVSGRAYIAGCAVHIESFRRDWYKGEVTTLVAAALLIGKASPSAP